MSKVFLAHIALFLVNALYGANHVIAKGVMPDYLTPTAFIAVRVIGATALFWIVLSILGREKIARKDFIRLALCGLFGVAINQLFFFHGLSLTSSINSGIIMTINPIMVVILSYFLLKERITWKRSSGVLIGAIGAILLTLTAGTGTGDSGLGDLFILINASSYAIYLVIVKPLMSKYKPITVITWVFTFGLMYILVFPLTIPDLMKTNFQAIPFDSILKIVYVIVGVTFLSYLLTIFGLKHTSASVSSSYIYFQPVMVIAFAFLFSYLGVSEDYSETITLEKVAYMIMIFAGIYLTSANSFSAARRKDSPT